MNSARDLEGLRQILLEATAVVEHLLEQEEEKNRGKDAAKRAPDLTVLFPLTGSTKLFKGTKPVRVVFPGGSEETAFTWKKVVQAILKQCLSDGNEGALRGLAGNVAGRKRAFLAKTGAEMRSPIEIAEGLYMETHYDTETLLHILTMRILEPIHYDYSGIRVAIRSGDV